MFYKSLMTIAAVALGILLALYNMGAWRDAQVPMATTSPLESVEQPSAQTNLQTRIEPASNSQAAMSKVESVDTRTAVIIEETESRAVSLGEDLSPDDITDTANYHEPRQIGQVIDPDDPDVYTDFASRPVRHLGPDIEP